LLQDPQQATWGFEPKFKTPEGIDLQKRRSYSTTIKATRRLKMTSNFEGDNVAEALKGVDLEALRVRVNESCIFANMAENLDELADLDMAATRETLQNYEDAKSGWSDLLLIERYGGQFPSIGFWGAQPRKGEQRRNFMVVDLGEWRLAIK